MYILDIESSRISVKYHVVAISISISSQPCVFVNTS